MKRRFQMRDGEKFFAEGRDQADFELLQQQMLLAGNWRLGLRRQVLRELMGLGRDVEALQGVFPVADLCFFDGSGTRNNLLKRSAAFPAPAFRGEGAPCPAV